MCNNRLKKKKHQLRRMRRELKRRKKQRKRNKRVLTRPNVEKKRRKIAKKRFVTKTAPKHFSFIDNTDDMLNYLLDCKRELHNYENILCDISNISELSSDAIAILAACINEDSFKGKYATIKGNAPTEKSLNQQFTESGFYKFVNPNNPLRNNQDKKRNLFHHESHYKVMPKVARDACQYISDGITEVTSDLYEMLIESMSNTNNHAAGKKVSGQTKWWLYTYNDPNGNIAYTFIDLGVGIFDSIPFSIYKKFITRKSNKDLALDLLDGKIKSSEKIDNNMRGRGIPQIASNSTKQHFLRAYIISNNVKIDLKSHSATELKNDFFGTMLYWEVSCNK